MLDFVDISIGCYIRRTVGLRLSCHLHTGAW